MSPQVSKPQEDKNNDKQSKGNKGSVEDKLVGKMSKIFKWKTTTPEQEVPAHGKKLSSFAKRLAPSPVAPREISSTTSKDQIIGGKSGQRITRGQMVSAAKATVANSEAKSSLATDPNALKKQAPSTSAKAMPQSNNGRIVAQASVPQARTGNAFRPKKWDYNNSRQPGKSSGVLPKATEPFDRMRPTLWDIICDRQTAVQGYQAGYANATSTGKEQQKGSRMSRREDANNTGVLTAADLASFAAADKAKFKDEELAAKRQYVNEHPEGGWDREDREEVYSERKVVAAHTAVNSSPADPEPEGGSESDDAPVNANSPAIAPAAQPAKATGPSLVAKAKKLDKGKGKAVNEDEEEKSSGSNVDFKYQVLAADDGTGYPIIASGSNARSGLLFGPPGPIEKETKKMPTGHKAIFEGTHHRHNFPAGTPQPNALNIVIRSEKRDPNDPNVVIARAKITHRFTEEVDWNNKASVKKLNKWRGQIFERAFGSKLPRRWKYTYGEMNVLCDILEAHLATSEVGGLMTNVDWKLVTTRYNAHFEGVTQSAGEIYASATFTGDDGKKESVSGQRMKESRQAPVRSLIGLRNQLYHFKDQRVIDLLKGAKGIKQEVEPVVDVENNHTTAPSEGSSSDTGRKIKKLILKIGNRRVTLGGKRTSSEYHADDEDSPPTKKAKLDGPTYLRGGDGDLLDGYDPIFNYADDASTENYHQGREFPPDSPFRRVRNNASSADGAAQAMADAQRLSGRGGTASNASHLPMVDQHTSVSNKKKRSREVDGNDDSDGDDEGSSSPKKAKIDRRLPRDARLPPANAQGRHPLPDSPVHIGLYSEPSNSNHKKRLMDDDQVDGGDSQSGVPAKKLKVETAQGPNLLPEAPQQPAWDLVNQLSRSRTAARARAKTTKKGFHTTARLPTLDDYFQDQ
ncbi:hypothetical protein OCU04_007770 [Sclerotinia nivalis]|uniref:Uncharacterized protein n=1 Tax=Sclerotinia nivalis TaxID=352851 RepID=A0A9X0AJG7_9HELO|nr:hypothetical protein OCU04_007770 [Sclerotinia nivalis]